MPGTNRLAWDKAATNLQSVKNAVQAKYSKAKCQKKRGKKVLVAQSCLTLGNPMDCRLPGSSVHGTLQARILEWVAISFSRGSSQLRD